MSEIDLNDFADGAVAERFNLELQEILKNIADPDTDPAKKRKLQLNITFEADERRDLADVIIETKTTLAPAVAVGTKLLMGYDENGVIAGAELKSGMKGQTYFDASDGEMKEDDGRVINLQYQSK